MRTIARSLALASLVALAACGGGSSTPKGGDPNADTPAEAYIAVGPDPVGVTTLKLSSGAEVEVWYPAVEGTSGTDTYDVRDFTPEVIRNILTGDAPSTYTSPATRDAEPDGTDLPVVLFSHGASGMRVQSTFLTAHLASWGMVVVSPDHWSRDLPRALVNATVGTAEDSVTDLFSALDLVAADDRFAERLDLERVAVVGHSAGGGTALRAAADDRIAGNVYAPDGSLQSYDIVAQCHAVFANVKAVLAAAGAGMHDLVDVTVYLTDMAADFAAYNRIWREYFPDPATAPCRTTLGITALPTPIAIELKCTAYLGK